MKGYIARIFTSFVDMPGKISIAIYFSGCSIRCKDCHNKHLWDKKSGTLMSDYQIMEKIKNNPLIEYVAFLGGEPTDQIDFLLHLCNQIKKEVKKPIAMYTGREFEVLPKDLLDHLDFIVCGPYRKDLLIKDGWPASSNQRVFRKKGKQWNC
ncbi:4Fe-4S cluster-binding domain-containing protein [Candidatus Babeliales bacterium]|nr:4Fe-4S cluster-binding domain-containing protein [Candidatus Babeliales bacterium]